MTGRAYMGEVLIQVWLKSIKKMSELLNKQVNAQKESLKKLYKPMKKCAKKAENSVTLSSNALP